MRDFITTKGIVLKTSNVGEYDKRIVVLTEDFGKITIFGRGIRRTGNKFQAAASPFVFGEIKAFPGKDAYSLMEFTIMDFFEALRLDFDISCMGMYFLEVADYYSRENNDDLNLLKLLYVTLRALRKRAEGDERLSLNMIRYVYELRAIAVNGEFPGMAKILGLSETAEYTLNYIVASRFEKLYSFTVSEEVELEIQKAAVYYREKFITGNFKSLEFLS